MDIADRNRNKKTRASKRLLPKGTITFTSTGDWYLVIFQTNTWNEHFPKSTWIYTTVSIITRIIIIFNITLPITKIIFLIITIAPSKISSIIISLIIKISMNSNLHHFSFFLFRIRWYTYLKKDCMPLFNRPSIAILLLNLSEFFTLLKIVSFKVKISAREGEKDKTLKENGEKKIKNTKHSDIYRTNLFLIHYSL